MRKGILGAIACASIALGALAGIALQPAQAQEGRDRYREMSCRELWHERNAIYAEAGYCFQTERARRVFGRGCFPPYGRLTSWQSERVARIQRWEARRGCRD
jgi:hypothetical protein